MNRVDHADRILRSHLLLCWSTHTAPPLRHFTLVDASTDDRRDGVRRPRRPRPPPGGSSPPRRFPTVRSRRYPIPRLASSPPAARSASVDVSLTPPRSSSPSSQSSGCARGVRRRGPRDEPLSQLPRTPPPTLTPPSAGPWSTAPSTASSWTSPTSSAPPASAPSWSSCAASDDLLLGVGHPTPARRQARPRRRGRQAYRRLHRHPRARARFRPRDRIPPENLFADPEAASYAALRLNASLANFSQTSTPRASPRGGEKTARKISSACCDDGNPGSRPNPNRDSNRAARSSSTASNRATDSTTRARESTRRLTTCWSPRGARRSPRRPRPCRERRERRRERRRARRRAKPTMGGKQACT